MGGRRRVLLGLAVLDAVVGATVGVVTNVATGKELPGWLAWLGVGDRSWWLLGILALVGVGLVAAVWREGDDPAGATVSGHGQMLGGVSGGTVTGPVDARGARGVQAGSGNWQVNARTVLITQPPVPAPVATVGSGQVVVGELPGEPVSFVPRDAVEELRGVFATGRGGVAVVCAAVTGVRGVGKTQVAAAYARARVGEGCPLVAWVTADTLDGVLTGLAQVADAVGVGDPEGDSQESAVRLRRFLEGRADPAVVVVDNAAIEPSQLRRWLPATGRTEVVVTSTDRAYHGLGQAVDVSVYAREQSVAYLWVRTGCDDPVGADTVAGGLGDLALALAQAAAVIAARRWTFQEYLRALEEQPVAGVLPTDRGDPYPRGTAAAILLSLHVVTGDEVTASVAPVLDTVALLSPDGISVQLLRDLLAGRAEDVDQAVGTLVTASLLTWVGTGTGTGAIVAMHRLVARVIRDRHRAAGTLGHQVAVTAWTLAVPAHREHWNTAQQTRRQELTSQCLAVWEVAKTLSAIPGGRDGIAAAAGLANRAIWHLTQSADLTRATALGQGVVVDCERVLGADHPSTLASRNNLAGAYRAAGQLDRAIPLLEAIQADCERVLGADHPNTLTSRNNLAGAYRAAGQLDRAIFLFEGTVADCERVLGADHLDTLGSRNNLANAYESAGQMDRAIPLCAAVLADYERVLGADHPSTLGSRNNLACAYEAARQMERAIPLYEATLADRVRVLGTDHPDTLTSRNNLAFAYEAAGQLDKAIPMYEATLADCERILPPDHPLTATLRGNLHQARG